MTKKYEVVALCGSTKFKDDFIAEQKRLTLEGKIVQSVVFFGGSGDPEPLNEDTKAMLDDMYRRMIDRSDSIHVINRDGYLGEGTKSEIAYAMLAYKPVTFMHYTPEHKKSMAAFLEDFIPFIVSADWDKELYKKYGFHPEEVPKLDLFALL